MRRHNRGTEAETRNTRTVEDHNPETVFSQTEAPVEASCPLIADSQKQAVAIVSRSTAPQNKPRSLNDRK